MLMVRAFAVQAARCVQKNLPGIAITNPCAQVPVQTGVQTFAQAETALFVSRPLYGAVQANQHAFQQAVNGAVLLTTEGFALLPARNAKQAIWKTVFPVMAALEPEACGAATFAVTPNARCVLRNNFGFARQNLNAKGLEPNGVIVVTGHFTARIPALHAMRTSHGTAVTSRPALLLAQAGAVNSVQRTAPYAGKTTNGTVITKGTALLQVASGAGQ